MYRTSLYDKHLALGAKMVTYAGYEMPILYKGLTKEHINVREHVGVFDVSHMGEFMVEGNQALDLIQEVTTNDASKLYDGKVQYSCLTNPKGGIIDDLLVYRINEAKYMLVVNASNIDKDLAWINHQNSFDCAVTNISHSQSLIALQGPLAIEVMKKLTQLPVSEMKYYTFKQGEVAGAEVLLSVTGYTGAGGFEIYMDNDHAEVVWDALLEAGKDFNIMPCGLAARDTLRLEMGFCLYGNDINEETSPLEAGLGWITKFGKSFTAKDFLLKQKEQGVKRRLVGFEMIGKGIPRKDYAILDAEGTTIGVVTSGTMSPSIQKAIGLGYIPKEKALSKEPIYIAIRDKKVEAKVVNLPFYKKG